VITLRRLNEVARSMESQLVYAIVPLEGKFEDQGLCFKKHADAIYQSRFIICFAFPDNQ